jgi:hypothetical protein
MNKTKNWLIKFATAQAYISTVSMPILAFWGLPLSLASFFGNLIASPIITVFIFISSLIFFSELFGIPNLILIKALELNTWVILKFVHLGSSTWLIGLQESYFLICIPLIATAIIYYFKDMLRLAMLLCLLFVSITIAKLIPTTPFNETIKCRNSKVFISNKKKKTIINCKATIGNNPGFNNWVEYKLLSLLYRKTGSNHIDTIYFDKTPTAETKQLLKKHLNISHIYPTED